MSHVKVLSCTEPGYANMKLGVLEARLLLLNAKGETLQSIVASLPKSSRDLEFRFPSAVADVRGIRFVSLKDEGDKNQFGDIALGELLISEQAIPVPP